MTLNYISLFSGIGCFEYTIHKLYPKATCLGFSEINPYAIQVYNKHYPTHTNLGDITKITEKDIQKLLQKKSCNLIVAGFPCQDLSSLAHIFGHREKFGLQGEKSKLFFYMKKILKWVCKYNSFIPKIIIENNSSMKNSNWEIITKHLLKIDSNFDSIELNGITFGVQRRNRIFWTNFKVPKPQYNYQLQTWRDILLSNTKKVSFVSDSHINNFNKIYKVNTKRESYIAKKISIPIEDRRGKTDSVWYKFVSTKRTGEKSRWQLGTNHSDNSNEYSLPITRARNFIIIRKRDNPELFKIRKLYSVELERLFFLPDGYVSAYVSQTQSENLLGNGIITKVIEYILNYLPN